MRSTAYIVFSNWRTGDSGVDTFIRHMEPLFRDGRVDGGLVEIPYEEDACRRPDASLPVGPISPPARNISCRSSMTRLFLSYLRRILHDVRILWPLRSRLRRRLIISNQFGCETLPLALRVLFPFDRVMAICHTHPARAILSDPLDRIRRFIERRMYGSVDTIIYNSNSVREEWRKRLGLERIKGDVIWYGIESPDASLPQDYPEKTMGTVDFVCVSRFVFWKGHRELIHAFAEALKQVADVERRLLSHPPMRLILVGDGPTWKECIQYARDLGLHTYVSSPLRSSAQDRSAEIPSNPRSSESPNHRSSVFFLGAKPNGGAYFNGADVGVQLTIEPEAFGIVLLEAMSRGKPVLGSRIGGIPEVIADGETGILVDPTDAEAASRSILELATNSDARKRMGKAGLQRWQDHFTVGRMQREYADVFRAILSRSG